MSDMGDLVAFLTRMLDEQEADARANRGVWPSPGVDDNGAVWLPIQYGGNCVVVQYRHPVEGYDDMAKLRAWATPTGQGWSAAAVLADVAAKRKLVWFAQQLWSADPSSSLLGRTNRQAWFIATQLALPFADRPGYREEWKP